ncbi:MAG: dTDP-4-dehydrorhamnose reductase [Bacteroidota bacterium]
MKIAIIGGNGQLGSDIDAVFSSTHEVVSLNHSDIDIINVGQVKEILSAIKPDVVINTAAAHNVPNCEQDSAHAFLVNGIGTLNLATMSNVLNYALVHYSTDYVFDGIKKRPYFEDDATNPLNVYAITKRAGENFVLNYSKQGYIIRISGIYGKVPCRAKGGNFITTMLRLANEKPEVKVVGNEILTPTSTYDIAINTKLLIEERPSQGIYHMTNEGECSWYEFAKEIFSIMKINTPLFETTVNQESIPIKRPFYSVLENAALKKNNLNVMPHWKVSLKSFLTSNV